MAQTSTNQDFTATVATGFGGMRAQSTAAFDRLRKSVLPDHDDHLSEHAGSGPAPAVQSRLRRLLALVPNMLIGAMAVLLLIAVGLFVFRTWYDDRIYPAVVVGDVNVGGLTAAEAEARLTERAAALETGTIAFTYGEQTWTPSLSELGVTVDLETSIAAAEALGRSDDAAARLAFTGDLLRADQVVPLRTAVDSRVLNAWFDRVDRDLRQPAVDARIVVEGTTVSVAPDRAGEMVDRVVATEQVLATLASLQPVNVTLPTAVDVPTILASDLVEVRASVEQSVMTPMRVTFEDRSWRIDGATLSGYLLVDTVMDAGQPAAKLSFDRERLAADLRTQFVPEVNREPIDARVGWNEERGLVALDPSETGVTIRAGAFADVVAEGFLNDDMNVEIPVVITRPEIDDENLDALGIETRLGRGDSNFAGGSWNRDQNIYIATELMNGTLVRPGGEFSFNDAIGEITYEKGYVDADVVVAEQVGRDVGGGVCQISTTVFRAAIYAGMPITEWHPHTYRLRGYEADGWGAGFDASILQLGSNQDNWADFRFENYTDGWLLVESWTQGATVIVNIYGTDAGREVNVNQWPLNGKNAGFTRVIYDAQGDVVAERAFASYFK
ncbi:MAG: VanW family protein [Chloroflexota bacterium]|nr:VanW family protein [Chloroflexota bacterium]